MTTTSTSTTTGSAALSGVDIARVALKAARQAARARGADAPSGASSTHRPARRTTRTRCDPNPLREVMAALVAERAWDAPTDGGSLLDQWSALVPELAGKVIPIHYNPATGILDVRPSSPAYATQLRLLGRQLVTRVNGKLGRTVIRDLRVLTPRTTPGTDQSPVADRPTPPDAGPIRTRDDGCAGYHQALAAIQRTTPVTNPAITAAIARQDQAIRLGREPEHRFAHAVIAQAHHDETTARTAAAASAQAIAERRARADKAARTPAPSGTGRPAGPAPHRGEG